MLKKTTNKYEEMMKGFGFIVFDDDVLEAINKVKEMKSEINKSSNEKIEEKLKELNKDIDELIKKGSSKDQAYKLLGIDPLKRINEESKIRSMFKKDLSNDLNGSKTELRSLIQTKDAFKKVHKEISWFESDYDFLKIFAVKVADFFAEITDVENKDMIYNYELLFDALYFGFEDELLRSRMIKAFIFNHDDVKNPNADVLHDYYLAPNDELFYDLLGLSNRSRSDATDHNGVYHRELDWFTVQVRDVD